MSGVIGPFFKQLHISPQISRLTPHLRVQLENARLHFENRYKKAAKAVALMLLHIYYSSTTVQSFAVGWP